MTDTQSLIVERETTHGSFSENSRIAQGCKALWRSSPGWARLTDRQRDALDMFGAKVGRILSGDPNFPDHWDDIAGYARLALCAEVNPQAAE